MKKLVALMGSPRKQGNTATLVGEIIRGAQASGAEAEIFNLNEMKITPCQSCFHCRANEECAVKDDMEKVYSAVKAADAVVIGSPVYMFQVNAQTKLLFDRLFPMMDAKFQPRHGVKKTLVVLAQGNPDPGAFKASWDANAQVLKVMGLEVTDTLIAAGANDPKAAGADAALMAKAFQAGQELVK
ncbi:flavodoxin family protein [Anaeroselena agilis]|uniref:Flavodoxin family protein n=1 Tax=Anaeroselena agilis TaxID=3063788 RepID=A0ABU3NT86_9FIRM|nr:flavodoxin family protein [Selenomonadales bacterium 4137-cl]